MSAPDNSNSCLYEGLLRHRRARPRRQFTHRIVLFYVDLAELPELLGGRFVRSRPGIHRFRRRDYLGDPGVALERAVRDTVARQTGIRPGGPIRVLTQLRSFGHCFNPVSFYYCFDSNGTLEAVLAEVTNTPWGERQAYVLPGGHGRVEKELHVSPFMGMDHAYAFDAPIPGAGLSVQIQNLQAGETVFEASLSLTRTELSSSAMRRLAVRYPFATIRVLALIYLHAIGIRLAGVRPFPHPRRAET